MDASSFDEKLVFVTRSHEVRADSVPFPVGKMSRLKDVCRKSLGALCAPTRSRDVIEDGATRSTRLSPSMTEHTQSASLRNTNYIARTSEKPNGE